MATTLLERVGQITDHDFEPCQRIDAYRCRACGYHVSRILARFAMTLPKCPAAVEMIQGFCPNCEEEVSILATAEGFDCRCGWREMFD